MTVEYLVARKSHDYTSFTKFVEFNDLDVWLNTFGNIVYNNFLSCLRGFLPAP